MTQHVFPAYQALYAPNAARKYLNADERQRFLVAARQASPPVRTLCETLLFTGCRITEALNLSPAAIQSREGVVAIRSLKKRERLVIREVPIPTMLIDLLVASHKLDQRQPSSECPYLWPWHRGHAWRHVKQVMAAAEISGIQACPRGLRHGFGVHAIRSGVPLTLVQRWLGHAALSTTAIYLDAIGPEERLMAERMWTRL
ncbi:MAG: tyrosine-type recombinase/integrase [Rhizobiales bacterium]|nr:tyrosine-type recombinase/integrase [Hyphomicrobiales bacterium]MBO6697864.1 tyrosine-type recombinase/integrase [Hyphomicrobiales bacterium]MBO6735882.1 tyrosine-type recombinase/integrase [Hyphomicrobiales bacterium]MBO6913893.1 tyrosine-type recombinase/integrase [Hyphomicrobiales bacterium]MBO6955596.1 tyrosine-type recombinase/integrase [Hyphomicrobiales bacterium]